MSLLCAVIHSGVKTGNIHETTAFAASQVIFLTVGSIEAGMEESGTKSGLLVTVFRILSLIALMLYGIINLSHF
jgi:hypothetical protein